MSYLEKTAKKLIPIMKQLKKRMVPEKNMKEGNVRKSKGKIETLDSFRETSDAEDDSSPD